MKKNLCIAFAFIALTALVTFLMGPEAQGGLPEPLASTIGQFLSRKFYFLFLLAGIGYAVFSPLEANESRVSRLLFVLGVVVVCLLVEQAFDKYFPWQPRPGWNNVVGKSSGFPSGHALGSFGMASVLIALRPRLGALFFAFAFLVAYSRVEVRAHYWYQVVAGALFGVLVGFAIMQFREKFLENRTKIANGLARSQPS